MNILILILIISIIILSFDKTVEYFDYGVGSESFKQKHIPISQRDEAISLLIN
jgi:CelD/BcsL family acetyltransferase involved in cellulose biosynthesis